MNTDLNFIYNHFDEQPDEFDFSNGSSNYKMTYNEIVDYLVGNRQEIFKGLIEELVFPITKYEEVYLCIGSDGDISCSSSRPALDSDGNWCDDSERIHTKVYSLTYPPSCPLEALVWKISKKDLSEMQLMSEL